jgi:hypothetical protein
MVKGPNNDEKAWERRGEAKNIFLHILINYS